jgi:hypothetical protein
MDFTKVIPKLEKNDQKNSYIKATDMRVLGTTLKLEMN